MSLEKASIDEAFIDFTQPVREELLRRYPYLATVPQDAPHGIDTPLPLPPPVSWDGLGSVVPVHPREQACEGNDDAPEGDTAQEASYAKDEKPAVSTPVDEVHDIEEDEVTTWHDVALSLAAELMMRIREDIRSKLGYTTSAVSTQFDIP